MIQFIHFRRAGKDDVPAIEALLREEHLPADEIQPEEWIVAAHEKGNLVLGCGRIHVEDGVAELADLVVVREHRSEGIGRFLVQRIVEDHDESICMVTRSDDMAFFEGLGFRRVASEAVPAWMRAKRERLLGILADAELVFGVRDANVVSF